MHSTLASKDQQAQAEKKMTDDVVIAESVPSTTTVKMHRTLENQASQKIDVKEKAVDFRYVPHGDGPCSCCGPWSE